MTYIFFAAGVVAVFYSILALVSLMNHDRVQKVLLEEFEPGTDVLVKKGPAVADAFWERAKILLQNGRFDAALVDCKRALKVNPNHTEAKKLLEHLFPPEFGQTVPGGKALLQAAEVEKASHEKEETGYENETK